MTNITGQSGEAAKLCIGNNSERRQRIQGKQLVGPACSLKHLWVCQADPHGLYFRAAHNTRAVRSDLCSLRIPTGPCPLLLSPATAGSSPTTFPTAPLPKGGRKQPTKIFHRDAIHENFFFFFARAALQPASCSFEFSWEESLLSCLSAGLPWQPSHNANGPDSLQPLLSQLTAVILMLLEPNLCMQRPLWERRKKKKKGF